MKRLIALLSLAGAALLAPGPAAGADFRGLGFKTPGNAVYCGATTGAATVNGWTCVTPNDGFYIELRGLQSGAPRAVKGYAARWRGFSDSRVRVLPFGRDWMLGDSGILTCRSRSNGLTCKHGPSGLSFWLGRYRGYRIYHDTPGERPRVKPLFRTAFGIYCGIRTDVLEDQVVNLLCWNPANALLLTLIHDGAFGTNGRASYSDRDEQVRGWRPRGFPVLRAGRSLSWRCRTLDETEIGVFVKGCSKSTGTAVITCTTSSTRLTCENTLGPGGFWVTRSSFYLL